MAARRARVEMAALEAVIARLDIRRAQVLVEAIIVEMEIVVADSVQSVVYTG